MAYEKEKQENYNNLRGINEKLSVYITEQAMFLDLRNLGFERPGALTSRPGTTDFASLPLATYLSTPRGLFEYIKDGGASQLVFDCGNTLFALGPLALGGSLTPNATTAYGIDFEVANDFLYFANGYTYQRYDGSYCVLYGVPEQRQGIVGKGVSFDVGIATGPTAIIPSGPYLFRYAPVKYGPTQNPGPIGERAGDDDTGLDLDYIVSVGATIVGQGNWVLWGFTVPLGHGVSSVLPYMMPPGVSRFYGSPSIYAFTLGLFNGDTYYAAIFNHFSYDGNLDTQFQFSLAPRYLETYNNMLFMAGFSAFPSRVWHSDLAAPEDVEPENFFDVRPNSDPITNMIVFQTNLIVFKNHSVHEVTGYSPETLSLKDMNLTYGCVNNRAAVTFNNKLWFVDEQGICEYAGSDTFIVSYQIESALNQVDKSKAVAFYVKKRNEVWFCFGQKCFVWDHEVEAWTIYDNLDIDSDAGSAILNYGATNTDLSYIERGASHIQFTRFKDDVYTDRGQAITLLAKTKFHKRDESTTEMWRRLYLNNDVTSTTLAVTLNIYSNYASGPSLVRSTNLSAFQTRIDFGVSAKSLSVEMIIAATEKVRINGYTLENRYLRST